MATKILETEEPQATSNTAAPVGTIKTKYVLIGALALALGFSVFSSRGNSEKVPGPESAAVAPQAVAPVGEDEPGSPQGAPNDAVHRQALGGSSLPPMGADPHAGLNGDPHATLQADPGIPVATAQKPAGPLGRTVAELYRDAASLTGQKVRLRGTVVRSTSNIKGWTYLHLRDGSGDAQAGTHDVTVTTSVEEVAVGAEIEVEGTVRQNVDLGMGYQYPLIVAEATLLQGAALPAATAPPSAATAPPSATTEAAHQPGQ